MKRYFAALIAAVLMIGMLAAPAMAAPEPRAWCEDGVEVYQYTDATTGNIIEVTKTTVCEDEYTGDITYEREVLYYWLSDSRGNGRYVAAGDMPTGPTPWQRPCGPARAADVCR